MDKLKVWIARDEDGELFVYENDPIKDGNCWQWGGDCFQSHIDFPSVRWEDDKATEAYITLSNKPANITPTNKQSVEDTNKQLKEIDWEQRRYEIVKSISAAIYSRPTVKTVLLNVNQIISAADAIINELKKQSK